MPVADRYFFEQGILHSLLGNGWFHEQMQKHKLISSYIIELQYILYKIKLVIYHPGQSCRLYLYQQF
jgi:hypothetical protein